MKRLLLLSGLFTFGVIANSFAGQPVTFSKGVTAISEPVNYIADCAGFNGVVYEEKARIQDQKLAMSVKVENCETPADALQTLAGFLPGMYKAELDSENILHIKLGMASQAHGSMHKPAARTKGLDPASIEERVQRNMFGDELYEQMQAEKLIVRQSPMLVARPNVADQAATTDQQAQADLPKCGPVGNPQPVQTALGYGTPYAYNMGYIGNSWNGLPYFLDIAHEDQARRLQNIWNTALIKVRGEKHRKNEEFLNQVSLFALIYDAQGCQHQIDIIDAGLANNWYEDDVKVPIGADQMVKLIFVLEDGSENPQAFGRNQWLQPRAVEKHAKEITVTLEKLTNARGHYNLKTHIFQEDESGEIKIAPVK